MSNLRRVLRWSLTLLVPLVLVDPVSATSLVRLGLEELARGNEVVVQGKVLEIHSYWNVEHTFILTDVRLQPSRVLKGTPGHELKITLMGGTVGETTTLIVGGPELSPGSDYVLFLGRADLPGARGRLTIRDLSQGAFDVREGRAFSQAVFEPLLPDARGATEAFGGRDGVPVETLARSISEIR